MNENTMLEAAESDLLLHATDEQICDCADNQELVMDKIASISYIAGLSAVSYGLLAISVLVLG